jgi:hypothetical protein
LFENKYHEYDCSREDYVNHVIRNIYGNSKYASWLLVVDGKPAGYTICRRDEGLYNKVVAIDLFIVKEYRGREMLGHLLHPLITKAKHEGAKSIEFHSSVLPPRFWEKWSFASGVTTRTVYNCDISSGEYSDLVQRELDKIKEVSPNEDIHQSND